MKVIYKLDEGELWIDGEDEAITCECIVRNELNGWRKGNDSYLGKTIDGDKYYSMPRRFPKGEWFITAVVDIDPEHPDAEYLGKWFIKTTARQQLEEWKFRKPQGYIEPTGRMFTDVGYGFHVCPKETSVTSLGCGLIRDVEDGDELAMMLREELMENKKKKGYKGVALVVE